MVTEKYIRNLIKLSQKPELYQKGSATMWTDPYISTRLLEVHLDKNMDLASRKDKTIHSTVDWILDQVPDKSLNILDLGCGPGLYAELFAQKGHTVTGVDFSENSINYATKEANKKKLNITYLNRDYLNLALTQNQFDLVLLIFTDFGPLLPGERENLLKIVYEVLKPGGIFIFDILNDSNIESKLTPKNWEISGGGFWRKGPYVALSESYLYSEQKVILSQHIIIDEVGNEIYRFWTHFFSDDDLNQILSKHAFKNIRFYKNIVPSGHGYESGDVTFCRAKI